MTGGKTMPHYDFNEPMTFLNALEQYALAHQCVLVALRNAFHQLLHADSFEAGVVNTVSQGGDTDTNGAIAGALLGRREGLPGRFPGRGIRRRPRPGRTKPSPEGSARRSGGMSPRRREGADYTLTAGPRK